MFLEEGSLASRIKKLIEDFYDQWYAAWALEIGGPCTFIYKVSSRSNSLLI